VGQSSHGCLLNPDFSLSTDAEDLRHLLSAEAVAQPDPSSQIQHRHPSRRER
jgi:hypothetical protein